MWKILLNLCFVWFACYIQTANTNFISDKTLRRNANCFIRTCEEDDHCPPNNFKCSNEGFCVCRDGYILNATSCNSCIPCYIYEGCSEPCCKTYCGNDCNNGSSNQEILFTATQIAMTGALILGIITIIALLWKMCSKTDYRRRPATDRRNRIQRAPRPSGDSTASGGSLQRAVAARLRDAPPPYVRSSPLPPPGDTPPPYHLVPAQGYVNGSFEGEGNIPPPEYSIAVRAYNNSENTTNSSTAGGQETKEEDEGQQTSNKDDKVVSNVLEGSTIHI